MEYPYILHEFFVYFTAKKEWSYIANVEQELTNGKPNLLNRCQNPVILIEILPNDITCRSVFILILAILWPIEVDFSYKLCHDEDIAYRRVDC